jgi:hypothetical protein
LGYVAQRQQGPWLVAAPLRAWQRADRLVPLEDVTLNWNRRTVTLGPDAA